MPKLVPHRTVATTSQRTTQIRSSDDPCDSNRIVTSHNSILQPVDGDGRELVRRGHEQDQVLLGRNEIEEPVSDLQITFR